MKRLQTLALSWRMLRRDWRSGELRILVLALIVAVAAVTSINLLTDRFDRLLSRESAEMIGGDLVVSGTRELNPQWLELGRQLELETAEVTEFSTVVFFDEELLLSSVKAASGSYPLVGELQVAQEPYGEQQPAAKPPAPGSIWVDARVLSRLGARVGDHIGLGATELKIDRVLSYEPDRSGNVFNLAPRILMNAADLPSAKVVQPGSRVQYKYLFVGQQAEQLRRQVSPELGPGQRLITADTSDSRSGNAMANAQQYLGLTALLAVFLAAIAVAMAVRRYSERHYDVSGMLRCIGVRQARITHLYLWQLALLALITAPLGTLLGWLAHLGLVTAISDLLPAALPIASVQSYFTGLATAVLLMLGVALPPVLRLKAVPPLRVFRRELTPLPPSAWLAYGVAALALCALLLMLFDRIGQVLLILLAVAAVIAVLGGLLFVGLRFLRRAMSGMRAGRGHILARSFRNLAGHTTTTTGQILSFGLTAMVMTTLIVLRTDLVTQWQQQLPDNVPNNFAFNIQPHERDAFAVRLADAGVSSKLYPIVRGRLVAVNGNSLESNQPIGRAPQRELNFTWSETFPDDNKVVAGQWRTQSDTPEVSIEQGLAERLMVDVGDMLTVDIAGQQISATINSIRTVEWESFSPNFFLIFQPGVLDEFSAFYLTSFRLIDHEKQLLAELIRDFPSVSIIEVDALIEQIDNIITQVSLMVEMLLLFVLLAGATVLLASIISSLDERLREGALMRAMGASRQFLRDAAVAEFSLLGAIAGLFAALGVQIICAQLYERTFDLVYQPNWLLWVMLPLMLAIIVGTMGYLSTRKVVEVSPVRLLS